MKYWLMKSEPSEFSIDDLKKSKTTLWTGVRNYQARNFMMKEMSLGDLILFYHSSCEVPGIVGLACVSKKAQPDPLQFDKTSKYYDAKATPSQPIWYCVEIQYKDHFKNPFLLSEIKKSHELQKMRVIQKGSRLSIQPVQKVDFDFILKRS